MEKTKAIVLHATKISETSVVAHVYTEKFGRISLIVNGVKSKRSVLRSAMLQPISLLELDINFLEKKEMQRATDSRILYPFADIPFNPSKNALSIFIAELLYRTLREPQPDEHLFSFLERTILFLDETKTLLGIFHLIFMLQYARFMGFAPQIESYKENSFFDLLNGIFVVNRPNIGLDLTESRQLYLLSQLDYSSDITVALSKQEKRKMIEYLFKYYQIHLNGFLNIKSADILFQLFD